MSTTKRTHIKGFLRFFLWFLVTLSLIFVLSYAGIAIASQKKTLPGVKFFGQNIGLKDENDIKNVIESVNELLVEQKITISFEDKRIETTYKELGIEIDTEKTAESALKLGKINGIPSLSYLKSLIKDEAYLSPQVKWTVNPKDKLGQLFEDKNKDAKNANLAVSASNIYIEPEENGYGIDVKNLLEQVESCFAKNCKQELIGQKITKKPNVSSQDLQFFLPEIKDVIFSGFYLVSDHRNVYPKATHLINLIDEERTVLNGKLTFSDEEINAYLESISSWFNVKSRNKVISKVDGAVLDEGREEVRLDIAKSAENIKEALASRNKYAKLVTTTSPIKEEFFSPGNNPGKYPSKFIEINLSEQNLYRFEGETLIQIHKVSTGKWSMPTPEGEFFINHKDPRAYSKRYELYMPYWMAFIGSEYGIHELPEWPDGTKEGESHLGTPVSHGCVRLGRGDAQAVYDWTEIGTPVFIHR